VRKASVTASLAALAKQVVAQTSSASATGLPTRELGKTGVRVSIIGLGGWHAGGPVITEPESIRLMHAAIDEGLTFFDNAWDYHDGVAEERMGKALAMDGRRKKVFLMTKNCERDYAGSMRNLEQSLKRLRTDHLDLWQFHETNYDNDPDWVFEKGGMKAALEARKAGKVRFIGFTGHKDPRIHLKMLDKPHNWDTVQMPINLADAHYRSFQKEVVPVCLKRGIGVIGMKGLGGGFPAGRLLEKMGLTAEECYGFCLSLPVATQVVGINSMAQLQQDIKLARNFKPFTEAQKSSMFFEGPHHRKQHGFDVALPA
jgi:uncharacterized protein